MGADRGDEWEKTLVKPHSLFFLKSSVRALFARISSVFFSHPPPLCSGVSSHDHS